MIGRAADKCASSRPVMATRPPSATSARAIANPMPREPPVTKAILPVKDCIADSRYNIASMRDVAIIGAGEVGGTLAHALARSNIARVIRLIDDVGRVAEGKALDIAQAASIEG